MSKSHPFLLWLLFLAITSFVASGCQPKQATTNSEKNETTTQSADLSTTPADSTVTPPSATTDASVTTSDSLPGADGQIKKFDAGLDFQTVTTSAPIVVIDFNATWCGPCKKLGPYLERMANSFQKDGVSFFSADTDEVRDLAKSLEITSIPDVRVYVAGEQVGQVIGCEPIEVMNKIQEAVDSVKGGNASTGQ